MNTFQIWAVGRNYADHAKELGHTAPAASGEPMIFLKAGACAVASGQDIRLPDWSTDVHHECEIALRLGADLRFSDLALALDLTARDAQVRLKAAGHPWTLAKSFRDSCPLGRPVPLSSLPGGPSALLELRFTLKVNGQLRQVGHTKDMIFPPETLLTYILERFPVRPGDWLLTGTPAGVARIESGDRLEAEIEGLCREAWTARRTAA
ncbi:MAG: fumarylacetoacetate hydrolase family protein [Bdellovibrionaceae bacterium]|nr:fumarylacetoacetate hydrolase family protein [Pseudobdellovibrionaceae bacterium]